MFSKVLSVLLLAATLVSSHCKFLVLCWLVLALYKFLTSTKRLLDTFPQLIANGQVTADWLDVRQTDNYNSQAPVRPHD